MTANILMSGPIRPSEDDVIHVIQTMRLQIPNSRIFLSTWTHSDKIKECVDYYQVVTEPTNEEITSIVSSRTIQQTQLGLSDETAGCKFSTYRMFYGVQKVCELAQPYIQDTDRVIRIRTDSMFLFDPKYLSILLSSDLGSYITRSGDGFDWFAITSFSILKQVWCFKNIDEYNTSIAMSWNPENAVARRINVPIQYLDKSKVEYYILRENGRKHYYP